MKKLSALAFLILLCVVAFSATLTVSVTAQDTLEPTPTSTTPTNLDPAGVPNYGGLTLTAGFLPDPWIVSASSGGEIDASQLSLGAGCTGFVSSAPDFTLAYNGTPLSDNLRILYVGSGDTTLIVSDPNGNFACADNSETTDPILDFPAPAEGTYSLWVGSVGANNPVHGYLLITEVQTIPGTILTDITGFVTAFTELTGAPVEATIEAQPEVTEAAGG